MSLAEQLADHVQSVFLSEDHFAEPVLYVRTDGSEIPVNALRGQERDNTHGSGFAQDAEFREGVASFTFWWLSANDISPAPVTGERIVSGVESWVVQQVEIQAGMYKVSATADQRVQFR